MSAEMAWYVGCPLVAAGLGVAAVRFTRSSHAAAPHADEEEEAPLQLAGQADEAAATPSAERADPDAPASGSPSSSDDHRAAGTRQQRTGLGQLMRRGVRAVVRRPALRPLASRLDVCGPDRPEGVDVGTTATDLSTPTLASPRPVAFARSALAAAHAQVTVAAPTEVGADPLECETNLGHGIVEFEQPPGEERPIGGPTWAAEIAARETALATTLQARDDAERLARRREDEAAALRDQAELERIAVAEQARVRAQARARRWFVRLDADLDAPTIAQRSTLATTLGIRAPWAGKLLREAFAQEEEPRVRARILGALVAGDHLDVAEPFEIAFARGGVERAAVWETLSARRDDAQWIAELLAPLLDAIQAA